METLLVHIEALLVHMNSVLAVSGGAVGHGAGRAAIFIFGLIAAAFVAAVLFFRR